MTEGELKPRTRIPIWRSIYAKFPLFFVTCCVIIGILQFFLAVRSWKGLTLELTQKENWNLASEIAQRLQSDVAYAFDREAVEQRLYEFASLAPNIDIFVLNEEGTILASYIEFGNLAHNSVDLKPIRTALQPLTPQIPLLGDDPTASSPEPTIFSVAPLRIAGTPGYLYCVLQSRAYKFLRTSSGQYYIAGTLIQGSLGILLSGVLLAGLLLLYLSRRLHSLTQTIERFRQGDFSERIAVQGDDEIAVLSDTVNTMADTIVARTAELRSRDFRRRQFIAWLVHDLRGPLTSARGIVETLRDHGEAIEEPERRRLMDTALTSLTLQGNVVSDLFELSKLEAKDRTPQIEPFPLEEAVHEAIAAINESAPCETPPIEADIEQGLPFVQADITLISRVLFNLLSNAQIHSPPDTRVRVMLRKDTQGVRCAVSNEGSPIPEEDREKIFEPFYRTRKTDDSPAPGTGLGLAIVRRILELHGSSITVESGVGQPTSFFFVLPCAE